VTDNDGIANQGQDGLDGIHASTGGLGGAGTGSLFHDTWSGNDGKRGSSDGSAGHGGGGGSAGDGGTIPVAAFTHLGFSGGAGGGGGAGACAAKGGSGGQSGGASFGIFVSNSKPTIAFNSLSNDNGGNGGDGGVGGDGGIGGQGGQGGPKNTISETPFVDGNDGADGGQGGDGGVGAGGGGGSGGISCLVFKTLNSQTTLFSNTKQSIGNHGSGGLGGPPGTAVSSSHAIPASAQGQDGEEGTSNDNECIRDFSAPISFVIAPNELQIEQIPVLDIPNGPGVIQPALFSVNSKWFGSDVETTLISPSGIEIGRNTIDPNVSHVLGPNFEIYEITNPETGTWEVEVFGLDVPLEGEPVEIFTSIIHANASPVAIATSNPIVEASTNLGALVALDGSESTDPNNDPLIFNWKNSLGENLGDQPELSTTLALGSHSIELIIDDSQGGVSNAFVDIQVIDSVAPIIEQKDSMAIEATSLVNQIVEYTDPLVHDDVDPNPSVSCSPESGTTFEFGTTEVICTGSDTFGNTSEMSFTVLIEDSISPELNPIDDIVAETSDENGLEVIIEPQASDNLDPTPLIVCDHESFFEVGETQVTCYAFDSSSNVDTQEFLVTVILDETPDKVEVCHKKQKDIIHKS